MTIKKIFASICIIISAPLVAMQPEQPMVTLVSAEGKEFQVPLDAAQEAGAISGLLLAGGQEAASKRLEFRTISSAIMAHIVNLLKASAANHNTPNKQALLEQLQSVPIKDFNAVIEAANFLDIPFFKDMIMLVSADDKKFYVPMDAAEELGTIKDLLALNISGATEKIIPLKNISSHTMKEIVSLLYAVHNNLNLKNTKKAFQDTLAAHLKNELLFDPAFLRAIDFLDFEIIKDLVAYMLAKQIFAEGIRNRQEYTKYNPLKHSQIYEQAQKALVNALGSQEAATDMLDKIIRYHFLIGDGHSIMEKGDFGRLMHVSMSPNSTFSIQDYLDYNPQRITRFSGDRFDLRFLHLASLEGLYNIPNISSAVDLDLRSNNLEQIQPDTFNRLPNLRSLELHGNPLLPENKAAIKAALPQIYINFEYGS